VHSTPHISNTNEWWMNPRDQVLTNVSLFPLFIREVRETGNTIVDLVHYKKSIHKKIGQNVKHSLYMWKMSRSKVNMPNKQGSKEWPLLKKGTMLHLHKPPKLQSSFYAMWSFVFAPPTWSFSQPKHTQVNHMHSCKQLSISIRSRAQHCPLACLALCQGKSFSKQATHSPCVHHEECHHVV